MALPSCRDCDGYQPLVDGCVDIPIRVAGVQVERIPFGKEPGLGAWLRHEGLDFPERCVRCLTKVGHFHHWACPTEECPICGHVLMMCGCPDLVEDSDREAARG